MGKEHANDPEPRKENEHSHREYQPAQPLGCSCTDNEFSKTRIHREMLTSLVAGDTNTIARDKVLPMLDDGPAPCGQRGACQRECESHFLNSIKQRQASGAAPLCFSLFDARAAGIGTTQSSTVRALQRSDSWKYLRASTFAIGPSDARQAYPHAT